MVKLHAIHDLDSKLKKFMKFVAVGGERGKVKFGIVEMRSSHIGGHVTVSVNSPFIRVDDFDHAA